MHHSPKKNDSTLEIVGKRRSYLIRNVKKFKNYDQTFQPENHYMELADGTKTSCVSLKRGDAEVYQLDADGNQEAVTLKKALLIPS